MLSTHPESAKSNWKDHLNKVFRAYNCTIDDGSVFSPPYLHFGCHQLLPIDLIFDRATGDNTSSHLQYVQNGNVQCQQPIILQASDQTSGGRRLTQDTQLEKLIFKREIESFYASSHPELDLENYVPNEKTTFTLFLRKEVKPSSVLS